MRIAHRTREKMLYYLSHELITAMTIDGNGISLPMPRPCVGIVH